MIEKINKFREYLDYLEEHYNNVQKAWKLINEKCKDKGFRFMWDDYVWHLIDQDVKNHDTSKLSAEEFTQYRQFFYPVDGEKRDEDLFNSAWEHHLLENEHHWQNWTKKEKRNPYADYFLVINIVDWVAMGFKFGGTAELFYEKNKENIHLPEWAVEQMYKIFRCIYE
jgi:hypothetical protein